MSELTIFLIIFLPIVAALLWLIFRKKRGINPTIEVFSDVQEATDRGVLICSRYPVTQSFKDTVDGSLGKLFQDAVDFAIRQGKTYNQKMLHSDYIIYVKQDCVPSPETRTPSFKMRADDYDGTVYDVDPRDDIGYIYASEYVIPTDRGLTTSYVICDDLVNLWSNVRHGAEHIILFFNDSGEYERTKFHGDGYPGHPIIPIV